MSNNALHKKAAAAYEDALNIPRSKDLGKRSGIRSLLGRIVKETILIATEPKSPAAKSSTLSPEQQSSPALRQPPPSMPHTKPSPPSAATQRSPPISPRSPPSVAPHPTPHPPSTFPSPSSRGEPSPRPRSTQRLILHLDVNKTCIMSDKASGKDSVGTMLNSLLSECVWGRIAAGTTKETRTAKDWTMHSPQPCTTSQPEGLVTFSDFLEVYTSLPMPEYKKLKGAFCETFPACRPHYDILMAAMTSPDGGSHFIVPAVFELIAELQRRRECYSVVFRTFGRDVQALAAEWNVFVSGKHARFPLDPPAPSLLLRLPEGSAALHRTDDAGDGVCGMHLGYVCPDTHAVAQAHGPGAVNDVIMRLCGAAGGDCGEPRCVFVQDDYNYWAAHGESDSSGKLLLLDDSRNVRQIFVDDNIERDRAHIVDVRRGGGGGFAEVVPFEEAQATCLLRAEPYDIIMNRSYFIQALVSRGLLG